MTDEERARERYRALLQDYAAALGRGDRAAADAALRESALAWELLRAQGGIEAAVEPSMHLVLVFSYAAGVGASEEARRIYELLSPEDRAAADAVENLEPGTIKIWK